MKAYMPQEIQVWYILPALRREFAKSFVDRGLTQKQTALIMGLTEPAVSHYLKSKRAADLEFPDDILFKIRLACDRVLAEGASLMQELYELSVSPDVVKTMCKVHRLHDPGVGEGCDICFARVG